MAISPNDLVLTDTELGEVMRLEGEIDEAIKRQFTKTEVEIVVKIGSVAPRVKSEVIRRYKNAGWPKVDTVSHDGLVFGMR